MLNELYSCQKLRTLGMMMAELIERVCRYADTHNAPETPSETGIAGFSLVRCRRPTPIEPNLYRPLLCVVLQGRKESHLGREWVSFGAGESLIVSLDLPTASRVTDATAEAPYVALALEIDLRVVRSLYEEAGESEIASERARAIAAGAADERLIDAMARLFDLLDRPLEQKVLVPLVTREIHLRMLLARHGEMLRRLSWRDSHASRIARAIAQIRASFPMSISVAELARTAAMSPSTFHEHFKAITATTPLQYQKDLRLLEAREQLIDGAGSVARVAYDVGFESPTQFSREYARKFGNPPRADRQRTRAARE